MQITPSLDDFLRLAQGGRLTVVCDLLADMLTPLSAYWKLAHDEPRSFLLESVTGGEQLARYSIIGVRPKSLIRTKGSRTSIDGVDGSLLAGDDPLSLVERALDQNLTAVLPGLPKFCGGAVGMIGYDFVRFIERLPDSCSDDLQTDDLAMMITDAVVVFDHAKQVARIIVPAEGNEDGYERAVREIRRIADRLVGSVPDLPPPPESAGETDSNRTQADYEVGVEKIKEYIAAGDGVQMVLSQRFSRRTAAHPISLYRALRTLNPSPYMFLLRFGDFDLIGASPELLVSLNGNEARVRPIAGTRPRGQTEAEDFKHEEDLLADEKERAEHLMLVDLGRNDLGRVSESGTVSVREFMMPERYSHVMHLVSDVRGMLKADLSVFDLVRAVFPAGTLSGAPKIRAMEIIDELEPTRRGSYGGAIGYFGSDGNADLAIAIRTIFLKDGVAYVQAGAGIVSDSVPSKEFQETIQKASACLKAVELVESGLI